MTTPTQRTGPLLRVEGTCEGCPWLRRRVILRRAALTCEHPAFPDGMGLAPVGGGPFATPERCPEMGRARLALGLLPPTFPARFAEALYVSDDGKGSWALHALLAEVGGTSYDPENDPRYNGEEPSR